MRQSRLLYLVLVALLYLTISSATENTKRAPSGFQGVRGKKSIQDSFPSNNNFQADTEIDSSTNTVEKRIPSAGFHGMRGKKQLYPIEMMFVPKRAAMGFMGMRGKKEMEFVNDEFDEKRAPNGMGFLGMRGKKFEDFPDSYDYFMDKRAPMGFLGMRGKKEYAPFMEEEKRVPADGFFGMRGKKQPARSSFFGMRGKKYPYEFRGKFVGVRGKKDASENSLQDSVDFETPIDVSDLDLNELMLLLTEGNNDAVYWEKRKGPSGFLGMRG